VSTVFNWILFLVFSDLIPVIPDYRVETLLASRTRGQGIRAAGDTSTVLTHAPALAALPHVHTHRVRRREEIGIWMRDPCCDSTSGCSDVHMSLIRSGSHAPQSVAFESVGGACGDGG